VIADDLQRIATILGKVGSPGCFTARRTAAVDDLHLEVQELGPLRLPISRPQAMKLCRLARPARYGRGEKTLLDRRVRDTWEVPKSRVKIDQRRWNRTLLPVLEALRADLGLADGCRLKAELHSFLIYGPGQFFLPHKDSEKGDGMVATLVVTLPAAFKGGALVVEHQGEKVVHRGSRERLSFVAFYADCQHEVRPVKEGYRITLTYNLILDGADAAKAAGTAEPAAVDALAQCLRGHFETPLPSRRRRDGDPPEQPPSRLVYLLDHEYTEHGLAWSRLKGTDGARAAALRAAAERCGCELVLALADIHEIWSCMEPGWDEPSRGRHRSWGSDEDDDDEELSDDCDDPDAYELTEFIEGDIRLTHWVDQAGEQVKPLASHVSGDEVCCSTRSSDLKPYASEYEGYMGNWGNTMDRWYRRAALVLWPRERDFIVRAEASPSWALQALEKRIGTGEAAEAGKLATSLLPFWGGVAYRKDGPGLLGSALRVADGVAAPDLAASLLQPFQVEALTPEDAPALVSLARRYGESWLGRLLSEWSGGRFRMTEPRQRLSWLGELPRLCEPLRADAAVGSTVARLLLRDRWGALLKQIGEVRRLKRPSERDKEVAALSRPLLGLLGGAGVIAADDLRDEVVAAVCADENELLLPCFVQVVRGAAEETGEMATERRAAPALEALTRHCIGRLAARLARPARGEGDWSIALPAGCGCELCRGLDVFLADPARQRFEWPLATEGRRHVHQRIDDAELPVRHETRRSGRPYTLVLAKTKELFEREARERQAWQSDLAWLRLRLQPTPSAAAQPETPRAGPGRRPRARG
jgi:2OG-Fe(II) oxygenase superfamily